jgi:transposase
MLAMSVKFSEEFKADAVALVDSGIPQKTVCKDLGISKTALGSWVKKAQFTAYGMTPSKDPVEQREMNAALKRIKELEMENEVLRRAAAYLSQANLRLPK